MGARTFDSGGSPDQKDLFIEIGAMQALPDTTYGPLTDGVCVAPLCVEVGPLTDDVCLAPLCEEDTVGHDHTPSPAVVKMVADSFLCAGVGADPDDVLDLTDPDDILDPCVGKTDGVHAHFVVGPGYEALYEAALGADVHDYIVPGNPDPTLSLAVRGKSLSY